MILLVNLIFIAVGNYFYSIIMDFNKKNLYTQARYKQEIQELKINNQELEKLKAEGLLLDSAFAYKINAKLYLQPQATTKTVILVHGNGKDHKWSAMKYAPIFLRQGFNVLVYDSRNHGQTGGYNPSYGFYEQEDLQTIVEFLQKRYPQGKLGVHGESMGAATALMHAAKYANTKQVDFYIADCAYSDLYDLYYLRSADYSIPPILRSVILNYLSLVCKTRSGFWLSEVSPKANIADIETPILFIHGSKDDFVPTEMSTVLFNEKKGIKAIYYAQGAEHARALNVDLQLYQEAINNFLVQFDWQ